MIDWLSPPSSPLLKTKPPLLTFRQTHWQGRVFPSKVSQRAPDTFASNLHTVISSRSPPDLLNFSTVPSILFPWSPFWGTFLSFSVRPLTPGCPLHTHFALPFSPFGFNLLLSRGSHRGNGKMGVCVPTLGGSVGTNSR